MTTPAHLRALARHLRHVQQLSIDVEHNEDVRYGGAVALLQLATHDAVYLIDTLTIDNPHAIHACLHAPLSNPSILKLLHGAEHDIQWLHRDFDLRVVNMFDTQAAADQLGGPTSLAHLQQRFCGADADAKSIKVALQTSDWSARPLSPAQVAYAVDDVWYLACIAAQLVLQLSGLQRLDAAVKVSQLRTRCTHRSAHKGGDEIDAVTLLRRIDQPDGMTARRLRALCQWRDAHARRRDCGVRAVLPDDALLRLAAAEGGAGEVLDASLVQLLAAPPRWENWQAKLHANAKRPPPKKCNQERLARLVDKFSAKGPVYDNCRMLSMDGQLLCFCDRRKLEWWVYVLYMLCILHFHMQSCFVLCIYFYMCATE